MRCFRWLPAGDIPPPYDLRRCGWRLVETLADPEASACPILAARPGIGAATWMILLGRDDPDLRRRVLLIGVPEGRERARLLRLGFGDVMPADIGLAEIDSRAERLAERADLLPRRRRVGPLVLDLFSRDGEGPRGRLSLHPREFALLWRLAETPGRPVGKAQLAADVWRMGFVPETNSIAVHVSRLRAKLALAGLDGLVRTAPGGGYFLDRRMAAEPPPWPDQRKWDAIVPQQ